MTDASLNAVIYTDGGCKPNPGFVGYGFHGYFYTTEPNKQGLGLKGFVPTPGGYAPKTNNDPAEITVTGYVDGIGGTPQGTNNIAEVLALTEAFRYLTDRGVQKVHFRADSKLVISAVTEWLSKWKQNGWVKQDQQPVANKEIWQLLDTEIEKAKALGMDFDISWVEGHSDEPGNNEADRLASMGIIRSRRYNESFIDIVESDAKGYWGQEANYHPYFSLKRLLAANNGGPRKSSTDQVVYYGFELGKSVADDLVGKSLSSASMSISYLNESDPVLDKVLVHQSRIPTMIIDGPVVVRLDNLFRPSLYNGVQNRGTQYLQVMGNKADLFDADKNPITIDKSPAHLALRALDVFEEYETMLVEILTGAVTEDIVLTDITHYFYETKHNGKKQVTTLHKHIDVMLKAIEVQADYHLKENKGTVKVKLLVGQDTLKRNTFSELADPETKVQLVTWYESPIAFRYGTLVTNKDGEHILTFSPYSNIRLINTAN